MGGHRKNTLVHGNIVTTENVIILEGYRELSLNTIDNNDIIYTKLDALEVYEFSNQYYVTYSNKLSFYI